MSIRLIAAFLLLCVSSAGLKGAMATDSELIDFSQWPSLYQAIAYNLLGQGQGHKPGRYDVTYFRPGELKDSIDAKREQELRKARLADYMGGTAYTLERLDDLKAAIIDRQVRLQEGRERAAWSAPFLRAPRVF